jgi:chromosome transmission fidelity protein 1
LIVLESLVKVCTSVTDNSAKSEKGTEFSAKTKSAMMSPNEVIAKMGGASDQVNLMELVKYLRESKLARKVSGFAEKTAEELVAQCERIRICYRSMLMFG